MEEEEKTFDVLASQGRLFGPFSLTFDLSSLGGGSFADPPLLNNYYFCFTPKARPRIDTRLTSFFAQVLSRTHAAEKEHAPSEISRLRTRNPPEHARKNPRQHKRKVKPGLRFLRRHTKIKQLRGSFKKDHAPSRTNDNRSGLYSATCHALSLERVRTGTRSRSSLVFFEATFHIPGQTWKARACGDLCLSHQSARTSSITPQLHLRLDTLETHSDRSRSSCSSLP